MEINIAIFLIKRLRACYVGLFIDTVSRRYFAQHVALCE